MTIIVKLTRVQFSWRKYSKIVDGWGFAPDATARAHSALPHPSAAKENRRWEGKGGREKEKGRRKGEIRGRRGGV
jgi:hypothetical protein